MGQLRSQLYINASLENLLMHHPSFTAQLEHAFNSPASEFAGKEILFCLGIWLQMAPEKYQESSGHGALLGSPVHLQFPSSGGNKRQVASVVESD